MSLGKQNGQEASTVAEYEKMLSRRMLVEIGWIIAGQLPDIEIAAIHDARALFIQVMQRHFPSFEWRIPIIHRPNLDRTSLLNPVGLLESAVKERDRNHWDFTFIFTSEDLKSMDKADIFGVISRALDSGVIALNFLNPLSYSPPPDPEQPNEIQALIASRIHRLVVHFLGHLVGLQPSTDPRNFMHKINAIEDIDTIEVFSSEQLDQAVSELGVVADPRLEEYRKPEQYSRWQFYLRSIWLNKRDIINAVGKASPWKFPIRLSRLTTAALSTMLVMMMTAEVWDVALHLPSKITLTLSIFVILVTTAFVLVKQRLLVDRSRGRHTEQRVTTNTSTVIVVLAGMLTTYLVLFGITFIASYILFSDPVIGRWVNEEAIQLNWRHYGLLGGFVGSVGLTIGALGASFESNTYFRYVTYVDEEF